MHSNAVFEPPFLVNFGYPSKTPMFNTIIQKPISGRGEIRASLQPYPLWKIEHVLNFARGGEQEANSVYQYVLGFFMQQGGQFSDFLYFDPNDNYVQNVLLGIGDGGATEFQLTRPIGIGTDIVQNLNGSPTIILPGYSAGGLMPSNGTGNLLSQSQLLQAFPWVLTQVTATAEIAAPDGGVSAQSFVPTGGATDCLLVQSCPAVQTIHTGDQYTFSIWAKAASGTPTVDMFLFNQSVVTRGSVAITLSTSWQRFSVTGTMVQGDTGLICQFGGATTWNAGVGEIDLAWAQLEIGGTPGAYFATGSTSFAYSISYNGIVQFTSPPAPDMVMTWTGDFYYRVRFDDDSTTFDQPYNKIWDNSKITLMSVIL